MKRRLDNLFGKIERFFEERAMKFAIPYLSSNRKEKEKEERKDYGIKYIPKNKSGKK